MILAVLEDSDKRRGYSITIRTGRLHPIRGKPDPVSRDGRWEQ